MRAVLEHFWKFTLAPIYQSLFRRWFQAIVSRQDTTLGELGRLQAQIQALRQAVESEVARSEALRLQVAELDLQVRNALAARWDEAALTRRMAALEDSLRRDGSPPTDAQPDRVSTAQTP